MLRGWRGGGYWSKACRAVECLKVVVFTSWLVVAFDLNFVESREPFTAKLNSTNSINSLFNMMQRLNKIFKLNAKSF